jgi:hypothetical protein
LFHGINPAMGWLFAVALGLHRRSRRAVVMGWAPIALGHALSVAAVVLAVIMLGLVLDLQMLSRTAGIVLVGAAVWHGLRSHRQRVRIGMQTGLAGLALWSFLMSTAHGAGLMLVPALLPLCAAGSPAKAAFASVSAPLAAAALAVHSAAMLFTIAAISLAVYEWVGLAVLRSGWINFDLIWMAALGVCGTLLVLA